MGTDNNNNLREAADELCDSMLPVIEDVAGQFLCKLPEISRDDLIQECLIGLFAAADKYEDSSRLDWRTFAAAFMIGQVWNYLLDKGIIFKPSDGISQLGSRIDEAILAHTAEHGHSPSIGDLAEELGMDTSDAANALLTCLVNRTVREFHVM